MRKIILILFIFVMTVYAEEKKLPEQASDKAKERKAGSPSQKKTNFDIEAYKAYEEALMNPRREEIIAKNLKIEKISGEWITYKLFNKNTEELLGKYEDIRIYISEDKSCTLIRPWGPHGHSEDEKIILFDNVNLKVFLEKSLKWFKERYGEYPSGSAGISKQGELAGLVLYPQELVPPPLIINILVFNKKGKLVSEIEYEGHFLGGENDTLEFSPKLKLMIGKEKTEGEITYIVFSIKAEKFICKSKVISYSPDEKYIAAVKEVPEFSEVCRTEEDSPGSFSSTSEEREEYFRIVKGDTALYKEEEIVSDIEPYVYIYDTDTGEIIGNIRVPMKQPYRRKWKSTSGGSIAVSPVKEVKFDQNGSKIIVTTEYEGKRKQQEFTIKEGIQHYKRQQQAFEKLKEKRKARLKEKKIPWQERARRGRIKDLRKRVQEIRKAAIERRLDKASLKELKQIEKMIKDDIDIRAVGRIRIELAKFEVKYNLMGHVSYINDKWDIRVPYWDGNGEKMFPNKKQILKIFPEIHPEVLKKLEEGKSRE